MALNYTGFYEIVEKLRDDFDNLPEVNRVTFGEIDEYDRTKETITPCVHIIPGTATMLAESVQLAFQLFCYDIRGQKKLSEDEIIEMPNGYQNVQDCLDTTWAILQSVLEKYNGRTLTLNSTFVRINPLPSFEPILEEGNSGVCGWRGSVTFELVSNADKC